MSSRNNTAEGRIFTLAGQILSLVKKNAKTRLEAVAALSVAQEVFAVGIPVNEGGSSEERVFPLTPTQSAGGHR